jgi:pimeloyl-ACP methyl ester carboxylesterase
LILFGRHDPTEEPGLAIASAKLCARAEIVWLDEGRHWIQRESPAQVNRELVRFLTNAGP